MTDCLTGLSERVCVWLSVQTKRRGKERERRKLRGEETPAKKIAKLRRCVSWEWVNFVSNKFVPSKLLHRTNLEKS